MSAENPIPSPIENQVLTKEARIERAGALMGSIDLSNISLEQQTELDAINYVIVLETDGLRLRPREVVESANSQISVTRPVTEQLVPLNVPTTEYKERKLRSLVWPVDGELITALLIESLEDPKIVYRGLTNEIELGIIGFDQSGRPQLKGDKLPSRAFARRGGWRAIIRNLETIHFDVGQVIGESDAGSEIDAVVTWTTSNMGQAINYSHEVGNQRVFAIIKPHDNRNFFLVPSANSNHLESELEIFGEKIDQLSEEFEQTVKAHELYTFRNEDFDIDQHGHRYDEDCLGPYIAREEIVALIAMQEGEDGKSFYQEALRLFKQAPDLKA